MREATGNLWEYEADFRCITTNGFVKKNGNAVMGRGCAREAMEKWPDLPEVLGELLTEHGNHVFELGYTTLDEDDKTQNCAWDVLSFPVKHHWADKADIDLIKRSAGELVEWANHQVDAETLEIVVPRPGCGNGGLEWEDVKPEIEPILDYRFTVITYA